MSIMFILVPLVLTLTIEPLFFFALGYRDKAFFIICLLINFITNATLALLNGLADTGLGTYLFGDQVWPITLIFEVIVILVEGTVYFLYDRRPLGFFWSFCANVISFSLGLLAYYLAFGRLYQ